MMTPLRFRAIKATGEKWIGSLDDILRHAESVPIWVYEYPEIKKDSSTGLYDKNNKEIFESDIVARVTTKKDGSLNGSKYRVVEWENMKGSSPRFNIGMPLKDNMKWEIIGNIWEHPELLSQPEE